MTCPTPTTTCGFSPLRSGVVCAHHGTSAGPEVAVCRGVFRTTRAATARSHPWCRDPPTTLCTPTRPRASDRLTSPDGAHPAKGHNIVNCPAALSLRVCQTTHASTFKATAWLLTHGVAGAQADHGPPSAACGRWHQHPLVRCLLAMQTRLSAPHHHCTVRYTAQRWLISVSCMCAGCSGQATTRCGHSRLHCSDAYMQNSDAEMIPLHCAHVIGP